MAVTNIHPVTSTVNLCLDYIKRDKFTLHDNKMERSKTITSYMNCAEKNDFELFAKQRQYYIDNGHSIRLRDDGSENLAFHMVQSFDTKIDQEAANEIGRKLAGELFSEYSCVISTHSDGDHTHNHLIFNAYKMDGSGKWNDCDKTKDAIRKVSDRLCEEYGLSIINEHRDYKPIHWKDKSGRPRTYEPSKRKEKLRGERISSDQNSFDMIQKKIDRSLKKERTFTEIIKNDIDDAVKKADSYENMIKSLIKKGYTIRSRKRDGSWLKYISYKPPDGERPIRDSTLGFEYSRSRLTERIAKMIADRAREPRQPVDLKDYIQGDISEKSQNIETLSGQKPSRTKNSRIEYLKNCINANLSALSTIEKYGVFTFTDFENRLQSVSARNDILNLQLSGIQKSLIRIPIIPSIEHELYKLQRKFGLLNNFYDECLGCISALQRINRGNNAVKTLEMLTSARLGNIRSSQALISSILENRIYSETEFPLVKPLTVMQLTTISTMKDHPDYAAAKSGEPHAAYRLAAEILQGESQQRKIKELGRKYPDAILVGIHAENSAGRNKIPAAIIHRISEMTGIEYDRSIVQMNKVGRTGSDAAYRLASRPKFAGAVQAGRKYIITDDVITVGGTLSELRNYIESRGGEVVQLVTGGVSENSANFALSDQTRLALEAKFGINALKNFVKECGMYEGRIEYLTESEGRYLLRFKSLVAARTRVAEARYERSLQDIRRT